MKPFKAGVAIALSTALLMPMAATAQEPAADSLVLLDPTGDLNDLVTGAPTDGPAYTDLTGIDVAVDGEMLTVRFDVAEAVPAAPDPLYTTVGYYLNIDTDGDDFQNYHLGIGSEGGWTADLFDYDTAFNTQLGDALVVEGTLTASVPLTDLGSPAEMRFQGLMQATDRPDPTSDPLNVIEWEDRVPDAEDEWLALGETGPETTTADPVASLKSVDDLLGTDAKPRGRSAIVKAVADAYAGDSTGVAAELMPQKDAERFARKCPSNPECLNIVEPLYAIYRETGNELFFEAATSVWSSSDWRGLFEKDFSKYMREEYGESPGPVSSGSPAEEGTPSSGVSPSTTPPTQPMYSVEELLAPLVEEPLTRKTIESRYPVEFTETTEVYNERPYRVIARVEVPFYSPVGSAVRTCGRGSFRSSGAEDVLHRHTACYLAVWAEWVAFLESDQGIGNEDAFERARETYAYAVTQLGEDSTWLTEALRAALPASATELASISGKGGAGFQKMIQKTRMRRVSPIQVVRAIRDAVAADTAGVHLGSGQVLFGRTSPNLSSPRKVRYENITDAGSCVRDLLGILERLPKGQFTTGLVATNSQANACLFLMTELWGLWRQTGATEYKDASEAVWLYMRGNLPGVSPSSQYVRNILREFNPDRRYGG